LASIVTVELVDDAIQEHDAEDFCVQLVKRTEPVSMPSLGFMTTLDGTVLRYFSDAYVTLKDDDEQVLVSVSDASVTELEDSSEELVFRVKMTHAVQFDDVVVGFAISQDEDDSRTAIEGDDYMVPGSSTVTIKSSVEASSEHSADLVVTVLTDDLAEQNEYLKATLTSVQPASQDLGLYLKAGAISLDESKSTATGVIIPEAVRIYVADVEVNEDAGKATYTVRTENGALATVPIELEYNTLSASDASAYLATGHSSFTENAEGEYEQSTILLLGGLYDGVHATTAVPNEGGDGDFTAISNSKVTIAQGTNSATFTVDILDNDIVQQTHLMVVRVAVTDPEFTKSVMGQSYAVTTINDNDSTDVVITGIATDEATGKATVTVTLSKACGFSLDLTYSTEDGSASSRGVDDEGDFEPMFGEIDTLRAGETSMSIIVDLNNDNVQETEETFTLSVSSVTHPTLGTGSQVMLTQSDAVVKIADEEGVTVVIASQETEEGTDTRFQVSLSHAVRIPIEVEYEYAYGTADQLDVSVDGCAAGSSCLIQFSTTTRNPPVSNIVFNTADDSVTESDETVIVKLTKTTNPVQLAAKSEATLTILDNDLCVISFAGTEALEGETTHVDFKITLSNPVQGSALVSIDYDTKDIGEAVGTTDAARLPASLGASRLRYYDYIIEQGKKLSSNDLNNVDEITIRVEVLDDATLECDEKFDMTLHDLVVKPEFDGKIVFEGGASTLSATSTIVDKATNEGLTLIGSQKISESVTAYSYEVQYTGAVDRDLTVNVGVVSNKFSNARVAGCETGNIENCFEASKNDHFLVGQFAGLQTHSGHFDIINDQLAQHEATFDVKVTAGTCPNGKPYPIPDTMFTVTLMDDEDATVQVQSTTVSEGSESFDVSIFLSHTSEFEMTVDYDVDAPDSLKAEFPATGSVTFPVDSKVVTVEFALNDDDEAEDAEEFTLVLESNDVSRAVNGNTITVLDNDWGGPILRVECPQGVGTDEVTEDTDFRCSICRELQDPNDTTDYGKAEAKYNTYGNHGGETSGVKRWKANEYGCKRSRRYYSGGVADGCNLQAAPFYILHEMTGDIRASKKGEIEYEHAVTVKAEEGTGVEVVLTGDTFVKFGETLTYTATAVGVSCEFPIEVPLKATNFNSANFLLPLDLSCVIAANQEFCTVSIPTTGTGAPQTIVVSIDAEAVSALTGTLSVDYVTTTEITSTAAEQPNGGNVFPIAFACGGNVDGFRLNKDEAEIVLPPASVYEVPVDLSTCFYDYDGVGRLTYSVVSSDSVSTRIDAAILTLAAVDGFTGRETLTVTATDEYSNSGSMELKVTVSDNLNAISSDLSDMEGKTMSVGETLNMRVTGASVLADLMATSTSALCTFPSGVVDPSLCTLNDDNTLSLSVTAVEEGLSEVCFASQFCFDIEVLPVQELEISSTAVSISASSVNGGTGTNYVVIDAVNGNQLASEKDDEVTFNNIKPSCNKVIVAVKSQVDSDIVPDEITVKEVILTSEAC